MSPATPQRPQRPCANAACALPVRRCELRFRASIQPTKNTTEARAVVPIQTTSLKLKHQRKRRAKPQSLGCSKGRRGALGHLQRAVGRTMVAGVHFGDWVPQVAVVHSGGCQTGVVRCSRVSSAPARLYDVTNNRVSVNNLSSRKRYRPRALPDFCARQLWSYLLQLVRQRAVRRAAQLAGATRSTDLFDAPRVESANDGA